MGRPHPIALREQVVAFLGEGHPGVASFPCVAAFVNNLMISTARPVR